MESLNIEKINEYITAYNKKHNWGVDVETFINHADRYIKAIKENRMICAIKSVSKSGMSRTIKFVELAKSDMTNKHQLYNFYQFFEILGYSKVKDSDYFRIGGCGMDMIFHTNYSIIGQLGRLGFIDKDISAKLAQQTPPIV
jgi:hypothetical protein